MAFRRRRTAAVPPPPSPGSIRVAALRLLGRRDYTTRELTQRLADRGYSASDIDDLVTALVAAGLVDDRRTAAAHVRTASRVKGRGPLRIRLELKARGLAADEVTAATAELTDAEVRGALDKVLARKRIALPVPADQRSKIYHQLLRRGFPAHLISAALRFTPDSD